MLKAGGTDHLEVVAGVALAAVGRMGGAGLGEGDARSPRRAERRGLAKKEGKGVVRRKRKSCELGLRVADCGGLLLCALDSEKGLSYCSGEGGRVGGRGRDRKTEREGERGRASVRELCVLRGHTQPLENVHSCHCDVVTTTFRY